MFRVNSLSLCDGGYKCESVLSVDTPLGATHRPYLRTRSAGCVHCAQTGRLKSDRILGSERGCVSGVGS